MIHALFAAVVLTLSAPSASADVASAPALRPVQEPAPTPGQAEFEATAEAFGTRMESMQQEMQAAIDEAGGDAARRSAALDVVEARYQADVEAFVVAFEAFVNRQAAAAPETERAGMMAGLAQALPQLRSVPRLVRTQLEQAAATPPAE